MSGPKDTSFSLSTKLRQSKDYDGKSNTKKILPHAIKKKPPLASTTGSSSDKQSFTGLLSQLEILSENNPDKKQLTSSQTSPAKKQSPTSLPSVKSEVAASGQKSSNNVADKWEELENLLPASRSTAKGNVSSMLNSKLTKSQLKMLSERIKGNEKRIGIGSDKISHNVKNNPPKPTLDQKQSSSILDIPIPEKPNEISDPNILNNSSVSEPKSINSNSSPHSRYKTGEHKSTNNTLEKLDSTTPPSAPSQLSSLSKIPKKAQHLYNDDTSSPAEIDTNLSTPNKEDKPSTDEPLMKPMIRSFVTNPPQSPDIEGSTSKNSSDDDKTESNSSLYMQKLKKVQSVTSSNTESQSPLNTHSSTSSYQQSTKKNFGPTSSPVLNSLERVTKLPKDSSSSADNHSELTKSSSETQSTSSSLKNSSHKKDEKYTPLSVMHTSASKALSYPLIVSADTDNRNGQTPKDSVAKPDLPQSNYKSLNEIDEVIKPIETKSEDEIIISENGLNVEKSESPSNRITKITSSEIPTRSLHANSQNIQPAAELGRGIIASDNAAPETSNEASLVTDDAKEKNNASQDANELRPEIQAGASATSMNEDWAFLEAFAVENNKKFANLDNSHMLNKSISISECKNYVKHSDKNIVPVLKVMAKLLCHVSQVALITTKHEFPLLNKLTPRVASHMSGQNFAADKFSLFSIQDASEQLLEKLVTTALNDSENFITQEEKTYQQRKMEMLEYCSDVVANFNNLKGLSSERMSFVNAFLAEIEKKYPNYTLVKQNGGATNFSPKEMHNFVNITKKVETINKEYDEVAEKLWVSIEGLFYAERDVMEHICSVIRFSYLNSMKKDKKMTEIYRANAGSSCSINTSVSTTTYESPKESVNVSDERCDKQHDNINNEQLQKQYTFKKDIINLKQLMRKDLEDLTEHDSASNEKSSELLKQVKDIKSLIRRYLEIVDKINPNIAKEKTSTNENHLSSSNRDSLSSNFKEEHSTGRDETVLIEMYTHVNNCCKDIFVKNSISASIPIETKDELHLDEKYTIENLKVQADILVSGLKEYHLQLEGIINKLVGLCKIMTITSGNKEEDGIEKHPPLTLIEGIEKKVNDMNSELEETRACLLDKEYQVKSHKETLVSAEKVNSENLDALKEKNALLEKKWESEHMKALESAKNLEHERDELLDNINKLRDGIKTLENERDEALKSIDILETEKSQALNQITTLEEEKKKAFSVTEPKEEKDRTGPMPNNSNSHSGNLLIEQKQVLIEQLSEQNNVLSLEIDALKAKLKGVQEQVDNKSTSLNDAKRTAEKQILEKKDDRELIEKDYTSKIKQLEEQLTQTKADLSSARKELESTVKGKDSQNNGLYAQIDNLKSTLSQMSDEEKELKKEKSIIDSELEKRIVELKTCNSNLTKVTGELSSCKKECEKLKTEKESLTSQLSAIKKELATAVSEKKSEQSSKNSLNKQVESLKKKLEDAHNELDKNKTEIKRLNESNNNVKKELTSSQKELSEMTNMLMEQKQKVLQAMEDIDDYKTKETFLQEKIDILQQQALLQNPAT